MRKLLKISQALYFKKQERFSMYLTAQEESMEQELELLPKQWLCTNQSNV